MRYHFEKPPIYLSMYGQRYRCDHPVYNSCTLFLVEERGLAVIQQRFDPETKATLLDGGGRLAHRPHYICTLDSGRILTAGRRRVRTASTPQ